MSVHFSSAAWLADIGDPLAKLVLLKLADNANDDGKCWPSISTICRETQLSERTVQRKMRVLESLDVISSDRGKNRCTYFLKMDQLNARLNSENNDSHPVTQSPRHTVTPSHSRKGGVTQSPLPRHTDTLPRHTGSYLTREPSLNHHRTVNEPSIGKTKKPKTEIDSLKSIGTLEEVKAFAKELGLPESDGEHMWHKWDESEWTKNAGKEKIKDWRKTLKTWKSGGWLPSQKSPTINHSSAASPPPRNMDVSGKTVNLPQSKQY